MRIGKLMILIIFICILLKGLVSWGFIWTIAILSVSTNLIGFFTINAFKKSYYRPLFVGSAIAFWPYCFLGGSEIHIREITTSAANMVIRASGKPPDFPDRFGRLDEFHAKKYKNRTVHVLIKVHIVLGLLFGILIGCACQIFFIIANNMKKRKLVGSAVRTIPPPDPRIEHDPHGESYKTDLD